jgi:hypothetical protein
MLSLNEGVVLRSVAIIGSHKLSADATNVSNWASGVDKSLPEYAQFEDKRFDKVVATHTLYELLKQGFLRKSDRAEYELTDIGWKELRAFWNHVGRLAAF